MTKKFVIQTLLWGFGLWLFGYILSMLLFAFVPPALLGWVITPFGITTTVWVLLRKMHFESREQVIFIGSVWVLIAIICDYFLLVKVFHPVGGYYKLDVYLYYLLTFTLPIIVVRLKNHHSEIVLVFQI